MNAVLINNNGKTVANLDSVGFSLDISDNIEKSKVSGETRENISDSVYRAIIYSGKIKITEVFNLVISNVDNHSDGNRTYDFVQITELFSDFILSSLDARSRSTISDYIIRLCNTFGFRSVVEFEGVVDSMRNFKNNESLAQNLSFLNGSRKFLINNAPNSFKLTNRTSTIEFNRNTTISVTENSNFERSSSRYIVSYQVDNEERELVKNLGKIGVTTISNAETYGEAVEMLNDFSNKIYENSEIKAVIFPKQIAIQNRISVFRTDGLQYTRKIKTIENSGDVLEISTFNY